MKIRLTIAACAAAALCVQAHAQHGAAASNMALLGHQDLQGRSAYQPLVHAQGARWIAYIGHHGSNILNPLSGQREDSGTSIVDVRINCPPEITLHRLRRLR